MKLGALGDFVQATGLFQDIRAHEKTAHLTLITGPKMKALAADCPWFDEVIYLDRRAPVWWQPNSWRTLKRQLSGFDMVYDLQNSDRRWLYHLLAGRPTWCGNVWGADYRQDNLTALRQRHSFERLRDLVNRAGVKTDHWPDVRYAAQPATKDRKRLGLKKYVVLVPGSSAANAHKRWPHYGALAKKLKAQGLQGVFLGGPDELDLLAHLSADTGWPHLAHNPLGEIIDLLDHATAVVGNDTGFLHIAAALGKPAITLFGGAGLPPSKAAPVGPKAKVLFKDPLPLITVADVMKALP